MINNCRKTQQLHFLSLSTSFSGSWEDSVGNHSNPWVKVFDLHQCITTRIFLQLQQGAYWYPGEKEFFSVGWV